MFTKFFGTLKHTNSFGFMFGHLIANDTMIMQDPRRALDICLTQGKTERATEIAKHMLSRGMEVDAGSLNGIIIGWCNDGKMSAALHVAKLMVNTGLSPDEETYRSLIQ